ncbi:MAG: D-alanyl-D-alanine carboxypeptidase family protein [Clostridia bacterium]|nr:D-alanyl-D-alanine carboxypeptidase family protein [Clostridia bacterium]
MNNFEENNEFVRRPSSQSTQNTPTRNIRENVRRPVSQSQETKPVSRPQNRIQPDLGTVRTSPSRSRPEGGASRPANVGNSPRDNFSNSKPKKINTDKKTANFDRGTLIKNLLIFAAMLAFMLVLGFALILSSLHVSPEKERADYTYIMNEEEIASVSVNGVLYLNFTRLSDMCNFTVSGTKASLRYTAYKEEYAEFTIGSRSAKINGDIINMEGAALVRENENVWVPLSFVTSYISGIDIVKNEKELTIEVTKHKTGEDDDGNPTYENITFRIKGSQTLEGIGEDPDIGDIADMNFKNDLSEYEQYMNPSDRDAYLILVNKTNTVSAEDIPEDLVSITDVRQDGRKEQLVRTAEMALQAMFIELRSAGYTDVSVTSGYRSYNKQVSLFSTYLQREMKNNPSLSEAEAKEIVLTYSAFPGTSEHHTGLCCDMHNLSSADVAFAQKEAYTWLRENCHKFGFIIRFPEDKVDITGYSFEPWHYRFVGRYHATRMKTLGMCLEEYIEHLKIAEQD